MTFYERVMDGDIHDLSQMLCDLQKECTHCPVKSLCDAGADGFKTWLKMDEEKDEEEVNSLYARNC